MLIEYNEEMLDRIKNDLENNIKRIQNGILETDIILKKIETFFLDNKIDNYDNFMISYKKKHYDMMNCINQLDKYIKILEEKQKRLKRISNNIIKRFE